MAFIIYEDIFTKIYRPKVSVVHTLRSTKTLAITHLGGDHAEGSYATSDAMCMSQHDKHNIEPG